MAGTFVWSLMSVGAGMLVAFAWRARVRGSRFRKTQSEEYVGRQTPGWNRPGLFRGSLRTCSLPSVARSIQALALQKYAVEKPECLLPPDDEITPVASKATRMKRRRSS